ETPESKGPYPVMIIIPGSGPTDRNGNSALGDNNSLKMVAESLAEQGIASLRYDKRGAGKNKDAITDEEDLRFDQFIDDAKEWVDMLDADERFSRIGITGHSQGSLVGMIAAEDDAVDVFVSLAGAGSSYDKLILEQLGAQLPDSLMAESEDILQHLKAGEEVENVSQALQSDFRLSLQPFLMSWMQYDPKTEIQDLNIPTLIVNGTRDLQISENEAKKLHEAKQGADLLIVDTMNHVLKEAPDDRGGNLETYWDSERPLADGLMDGIFDFLEEVGFPE
ncbi:MAG TPA: alpha/beta hydrolase, partial [Bacillota bacterium]|nr:alpha/beta hydrolase [Bacillota bacterium]